MIEKGVMVSQRIKAILHTMGNLENPGHPGYLGHLRHQGRIHPHRLLPGRVRLGFLHEVRRCFLSDIGTTSHGPHFQRE